MRAWVAKGLAARTVGQPELVAECVSAIAELREPSGAKQLRFSIAQVRERSSSIVDRNMQAAIKVTHLIGGWNKTKQIVDEAQSCRVVTVQRMKWQAAVSQKP